MSHSGHQFGAGKDTQMDVDENRNNGRGQCQLITEVPKVPGPFDNWCGFTTPGATAATPQVFGQQAPPTTLSGKFLSVSAGQMTSVPRPQVPSASSLQTLQPQRKQQVIVPDKKGILRSEYVRPETIEKINSIVAADKLMDVMSTGSSIQQTTGGNVFAAPAVSLGSIPSTSSLHSSSASIGSHGSQTSQGSDR